VINDIEVIQSFQDLAVYLDGYTYHASKEHLRFYDDLEKRNSIEETPNISHWSLSWTDVLLFEDGLFDAFYLDVKKYRKCKQLLDQLPLQSEIDLNILKAKNSIERLLWWLTSNKTTDVTLGYFLALFQELPGKNLVAMEDVSEFHNYNVPFSKKYALAPSATTYMISDLTQSNELFKSRVLVKIGDLSPSVSFTINEMSDINKVTWENFLRLYSLLSKLQ
jgi:DEAD/DEAH box helicase domain-containing protein